MFKNVKYLFTTHDLNLMPQDDEKEIVIVGKSNVGKSTLINLLTNNKKLAFVSSRPGKTKAISFFDIDSKFRLVDIPGYGYAKVSKKQLDIFVEMLTLFFDKRQNIKLVVMLLDVRREFDDDNKIMFDFLKHKNIDFIIVGTKNDKANQSEKHFFKKMVDENFGITNPLMISSFKKENIDKLINVFKEKININ